jgi:hypothetical protein
MSAAHVILIEEKHNIKIVVIMKTINSIINRCINLLEIMGAFPIGI